MHVKFPLPVYGSRRWRILMSWRRRQLYKEFPEGKISPHFRVEEFFCKDKYKSPFPTRAVPGIRHLVSSYLEPLRTRFGVCKVNSGYRPEPYNTNVGGVRFSQHIWDNSPESVAVDVSFSTGTPKQWALAAKRIRNKEFDNKGGIGVYTKWIHIDTRAYQADW